ncbi:MAG: hypothetical protein J5613_01785 [Alphaproteobacteria bacterium]|nr:hypothetical protein [Alphaproteobacteria bacterium]
MKENLFPFPENFNMYAILDHCREIQVLTDQQRIIKASTHATKKDFDLLSQKLNGELADLYLYLENYFMTRQDVVKARREKVRSYNKKK